MLKVMDWEQNALLIWAKESPLERRAFVRWDFSLLDVEGRNVNKLGDKRFKNGDFLSRVVVVFGMKVSVSMSLFTVHLVRNEAIELMGAEDVKNRHGVVLLDFHGKLNMGRNTIFDRSIDKYKSHIISKKYVQHNN